MSGFQIPDQFIFTHEQLDENEQYKNEQIQQKIEQNSKVEQRPVIIIDGQPIPDYEFNYQFFISVVLNPLRLKRLIQLYIPSPLPEVKFESFTFQETVKKLFPPRVDRLYAQYNAQSPQQEELVRDQTFMTHMFELQYAIRKYATLFDLREITFQQLMFLIINHHFKISDSELLRDQAKHLSTILNTKFESLSQVELFYLQRLNFQLKQKTPDDFFDDFKHKLSANYDIQFSKFIHQLVQTSQIILFFNPDIIEKFIVCEIEIFSKKLNRIKYYEETSSKIELLAIRDQLLDYGWGFTNTIGQTVMPDIGGFNFEQLWKYLYKIFNKTTIQFE